MRNKKKLSIITHRGFEPSKPDFYYESSFEAFYDHLRRGYGIEFDANFTEDGKIVIFHDVDLNRITEGENKAKFSDLTSNEVKKIRLGEKGDQLCFLDELLAMIKAGADVISALHLKGKYQEREYLDILLGYLSEFKEVLDRLIIFDLKIETAKYLKEKIPELLLAPSMAHPYDIERYNQIVSGTLISLKDVIANKNLFAWSWLDEWDLLDKNGGRKKFYTKEVFSALKENGLKIALVTPELHGTSPGLLGGEAHQDAVPDRLFARIKEIIGLEPDAICTDHPEKAGKLIV